MKKKHISGPCESKKKEPKRIQITVKQRARALRYSYYAYIMRARESRGTREQLYAARASSSLILHQPAALFFVVLFMLDKLAVKRYIVRVYIDIPSYTRHRDIPIRVPSALPGHQ